MLHLTPLLLCAASAVLDLCTWVHPLQSSLCLLCALLLTFLLHAGYTVVTLVSYLLMLQLLTCFLFINGSKFVLRMKGQNTASGAQRARDAAAAAAASKSAATTGSSPTDSSALSDDASTQIEYVSLASLQALVPVFHASLNGTLNTGMHVIRCGSNSLTLRIIGALFLASLVGRVMDGVTLFGLACIGALALPKLYTLNQPVVDAHLAKLNAAVEKVARMVSTLR